MSQADELVAEIQKLRTEYTKLNHIQIEYSRQADAKHLEMEELLRKINMKRAELDNLATP